MRSLLCLICLIVALGALAGCAHDPTPDIASDAKVKLVKVGCTTTSTTNEPCIGLARQTCENPTLRDVQLRTDTPVTTGVDQHSEGVYNYQATYACAASQH
jgi:hypothetical protein